MISKMCRFVFSVLLVFYAFSFLEVNSIGPAHVPTKGEVWPKPRSQVQGNMTFTFDPEKFHVEITGNNCSIVANRIRHYIYEWKQLKKLANKYKDTNADKNADGKDTKTETGTENTADEMETDIEKLIVQLDKPCEEYPHLDMDESYNLTVSSSSKLKSSSVWGIVRGLETFSQLFYFTDDFEEIKINATEISDYPAYKHRGLLLDTARHFIPVKDILLTIEALAINKMNVFHWHIVDDQSFPYQSEKFPDLSEHGAYHKSMVYRKSDIETIIEYATMRGVRVIPEFDVPGHTQSWGAAYPNLLTDCRGERIRFSSGGEDDTIGLGPMNPVRNTTYKLLRDLFQEVQNLFPDHYIHVGGDEVELTCWSKNPEIARWMIEHNMESVSELHGYFMSRTLPLLEPRGSAIVWQEVFDENVTLTNNTLVQVWKNWDYPGRHMYNALKAGYRVLFSSYWYLDHLDRTFENMLLTDPRAEVDIPTLMMDENNIDLDKVIGGEACMWAEMVDETNLHSRIWPRASAAAERLWSGPPAGSSPDDLSRAEEHVCRMKRRGVPTAPSAGPGFCLS